MSLLTRWLCHSDARQVYDLPVLVLSVSGGLGPGFLCGRTVTNTGRWAGQEVVQLYVSDLVASVAPAGKRLKRFAKVPLQPGESRTLNFDLRREDLSFISSDNKPVVEPGI